MSARLNLGLVVIRADRRWCEENAADATSAEHLNAIIRAVEDHVGIAASDRTQLELANARTLLGKVVRAVTGSWKAAGNHAEQVAEALKELRLVRDYLTSLNTNQRGAA